MSRAYSQLDLHVPSTLERQLLDFRRQVWITKTVEAVGAAIFVFSVAWMAVFALDRLGDTGRGVRTAILAGAVAAWLFASFYLRRWIWRHRHLDQLARLLSRKMPRIGDRLLGIIELAHSYSEQARSRTLCKAAIEQVADDAARRDFSDAAPNSRHRMWGALSVGALLVVIALFVLFPLASRNAWARFISPWNDVPRYTFAAVEPLPATLIVPHGEPFAVTARLFDETASRPKQASVQLGNQEPVKTDLADNQYTFQLPPQIDDCWLTLSVGDWYQTVRVEPTLRPELKSVTADVSLPEYLGRPEKVHSDVRGGSISLVQGSRVSFSASATRELSDAEVDRQKREPVGDTITTEPIEISENRQIELGWKDRFGLAGRDPFKLSVVAREDEAPTVACEDLPRQKVVLDSEQLVFKIKAHDDFGVKQVGITWRGLPSEMVDKPAQGESVLAAGGYDKAQLDLTGTFTAKDLGIEPQPIHLRVFVEDYLPGRKRVLSAPYTLFVLNPEQHAIWITEQLSRWHHQALEVRDREMQLYETNKQLRDMTPEELDHPDTRKRIENQAQGERANGRRLAGLSSSGEQLIREASRNPEIGVGNLDKWAEMLGILKDISANRMPSVADLLKEASTAPASSNNNPIAASSTANAGQSRAAGRPSNPAEQKDPDAKKPPAAPQIADGESSQQPPDNKPFGEPKKKNPTSPSLRLPVTTLMGNGGNNNNNTPAAQKVDQAVKEQKDLLAEFQKVADELNAVLANLEGSTLVKRLKAASRLQAKVSNRIGGQLEDVFGAQAAATKPKQKDVFDELGKSELKSVQDVSYIMDDMQAYFERRRMVAFKSVLDEMRKQDVLGSLRRVADDVAKQQGLSMSQCDYWSDVLDRWAEDLVDPACKGECNNCRSKGSLPPAIVLEVLQILEGEVNLREDTRVAEQAKAAIAADIHAEKASKLSETQKGLAERVGRVVDRIKELPDGEEEFAKEIQLLGAVNSVMDEAAGILNRPETGSLAIAAETEAIELLLRSKRINPKGGGGGGASPGGGGGGTTNDLAAALLGGGANQKEAREDHGVSQSLGKSGPSLPEEFRAGLSEYFSRLERPADEK